MKQQYKKILIRFVIVICLLLCFACEKMVFTEGPLMEKVFRLQQGKIDIRISDVFDVELIKDSARFIRVAGGENLVNHVYVHEGDTFLSIRNDASFRWLADYERLTLQLHIDTIQNLFLEKASSLHTKEPFHMKNFNLYAIADYHEVDIDIRGQHFFFMTSHTTTGKFRFKGEVRSMILWPHYASKVNAAGLKADNALVINHSLGDIFLHVKDELHIANYRDVSYYLKGNPQIINRQDAEFDEMLISPEIRNHHPVNYQLISVD
jgi:hypothetical protein